MTTTHRPTRAAKLAILPALLVAVLAISGCAGGGSDMGGEVASTSDDSAGDSAADESAPEPQGDTDAAARQSADGVASLSKDSAPDAKKAADPVQTRAVISTGTVSLRSKDVAKARFDVQKVADSYRGQISDEETNTDRKGRTSTSRMVIRVPSASFGEAMTALSEVADLESSTRSSEDVTTKVIDNEVRIRAQGKSLERVELLLGRARNLRDIVAIEAQLTRRQADLDSLKAQQSFLKDQTSLSTITVHIERTAAKAPPKEDKKDDKGFLSGLSSGWGAFTDTATGIATVAGALLPFAIAFLVLGVPIWLVARPLLRRRTPPAAPSEG